MNRRIDIPRVQLIGIIFNYQMFHITDPLSSIIHRIYFETQLRNLQKITWPVLSRWNLKAYCRCAVLLGWGWSLRSGVGGMQLRHAVFTLVDGFEDSVRLYCMFVIQLVVFHYFLKHVNFFVLFIILCTIILFLSHSQNSCMSAPSQ